VKKNGRFLVRFFFKRTGKCTNENKILIEKMGIKCRFFQKAIAEVEVVD
jgi:hypothetical protein